MNYTKIKIFNITLKNLRTTVLENHEKDIEILKEYYDLAVEQVLKDYDWEFANSYIELFLTGDIPTNPKFLYEYNLPSDCICAREIISYTDDKDISFEIVNNFINTNITPAVLRYTKLIDNEMFYPTEFVIMLSWYLAFLTAIIITKNIKIQKECYEIYMNLLNKQKMLCHKQENYKSWIEVR